ncbi:Rieske (2Fe-2S) protein [Streptomyces sp. YIM 98790]|uniref:Rieske 2Fe-2S domain-containing protein n=1 Tax=Streptomyces sp. YIM 98790 TaxID=2689077 RepID=UPI00140825EC|nr:Rieske (2Fe-2S) protein [Streptomyces sp. YIM 98790]
MATVDGLEHARAMDPVLDGLRRGVRALPLGGARDALHGRWLGHPLHPALVQVPLGAWSSAAVLDLLPGKRRSAGTLVALGLAGAAPSAVAGWVDWAELPAPHRRVGAVHAAANATAVICYSMSLAARLRGRGIRGRLWGFAGLAAVGAGGALGGHLAYRQGAAVNHAEAVSRVAGSGWQELGAVADFPVGQAVRRRVGEVPVMVVRETGGQIRVLADRCSHMAGPLSEGELSGGCVRCPWHGSVFRLADGWNVSGPATAPQPVFDTRVADGRLQARARQAPHDRVTG